MENIQVICWEPKIGEGYYYFNSKGCIEHQLWSNGKNQRKRMNFGVVFKTRGDALAARDAIHDVLVAYWLNHGHLLIQS